MAEGINTVRARDLLSKGDLRTLFIDELGWDRHSAALEVSVNGSPVRLPALAQKRGMVAYHCPTAKDSPLPDYAQRRKIEHQVAKSAHEHMLVFTDARAETQIWQWVKREPGKPAACREHIYHSSQPGDALLQKLDAIAFTLDEESALSLMDVTHRARAAFDVERITKRFYDRFQNEHTTFLKFITGITERADHEWYASVMLNRLMFVYFIQRKGFLDGDADYLRHRLSRMRHDHGKNKFYSFYRYFLLRLFHEGLGGRKRSTELEKLVGRIPYLNGGLFDVHELERPERYGKAIQIPDEAFERVFDFFDQYQWHLDERPLRQDNEINPDVLGYIFEKYVNQKQMGAYYTKEDITEYIAKNTVLPFVLEATKVKCRVAFDNPKGPTVWDLLKDAPDRYIYSALRHGVSEPLPKDIADGVNPPTRRQPVSEGSLQTLERRKEWNRQAPAAYGLPSETWREVVTRRKRYEDLRAQLAAGDVRDVDDLLTLNVDIRQFAQDLVENCEGPDLLRAFWHGVEKVTILDPTCGSGAFLFAALNILEPLYEACLDRMEAFVADLERSGEKHRPEKYSDFRNVLAHVAAHPNRRYFIFKSIILNNLFGVDIMEEAVEICKLRLFLKLAAQVSPDTARDNLGIEPLPDIDFNIRAGNTLVGYAHYEEVKRAVGQKLDFDSALDKIAVRAADLQQAFDAFRARQVEGDGSVPTEHKQELRKRLNALDGELDGHLASDYGISVAKKDAYAKWLKSHQPFHWFVEFYGIMNSGGFDVIIGNPPYVEYNKVRHLYTVLPSVYSTISCGNLYALVLERADRLVKKNGWTSLIVPLSLVSTARTTEVRRVVRQSPTWIACYDMRPASLFDGVAQRLSIFISHHVKNDAHKLFTGGYRRWSADERPSLIQQTNYTTVPMPEGPEPFPKFARPIENAVLNKIAGKPLAQYVSQTSATSIFVHRIVRYFVKALNFVPLFVDAQGKRGKSEDYKEFTFDRDEQDQIAALLNSTLFYWFWRSHSDGFHCGYSDVYAMPYAKITESTHRQSLRRLLSRLMRELQNTSEEKTINTKAGKIRYQEFRLGAAKPILNQIDEVLGRHYGFTEEELDFVINYDTKYRMGRDGDGDDE